MYVLLIVVHSRKSFDKEHLWDKWKQDIPTLDREDCLENCPKLVIASRDKNNPDKIFTQFISLQSDYREYTLIGTPTVPLSGHLLLSVLGVS